MQNHNKPFVKASKSKSLRLYEFWQMWDNFDCLAVLFILYQTNRPVLSSIQLESFQLNAIQSNSILFASNFIFFIIHWPNVFFSLFSLISQSIFSSSAIFVEFLVFFCHRKKNSCGILHMNTELLFWFSSSSFLVFLSLSFSVSFDCFLFTLSFQQIYVY